MNLFSILIIILLFFTEKPKIITHPKSTAAEVNGQASFTCEATGDPAPTYQWYRDDNPIYFGDGYNTNKLTLKKITKGDSNSYHCEVKNSHGTAKSNKAQLTVYGKQIVIYYSGHFLQCLCLFNTYSMDTYVLLHFKH